MKRLILGISLALALSAQPAHARGVLVICDSTLTTASGYAANYKPFFDLLGRSVRPGFKVAISNDGGISHAATSGTGGSWTRDELVNQVKPTGTAPKYDYDLIIALEISGDEYLENTYNRPIPRLTLGGERPRVPVLYISNGATFFGGTGGDDSTGCATSNILADSSIVVSPAGFGFPVKSSSFARRLRSGEGNGDPGTYVTPVLTLGGRGMSKADPDGFCGLYSNPNCDTLAAWFWNPPIRQARADSSANTAGYGFINMELASSNVGGAQYPASALALVAVGMAAKLAPACFQFPVQNIAVDVDDGMKMFTTTGINLPQVNDAVAGLDSLNAWGIPFTYCVETDSMNAQDSNGKTRAENQFPTVFRRNLGKVTVHNHAGTGSGGAVADTALASASGGVYTDIFGVQAARYSLIGPTAATRNKSTLWLLDGATRKLIDYVGDSRYVSREVIAPTDNYRTLLASGLIKSDLASGVAQFSSYDSIAYACRMAAGGYKGFPGYTVIRTQYLNSGYNYLEGGGTGGVARGFSWSLPSLYTIAPALDTPLRPIGPARILYASSQYGWGTTTDTVSTQDYGQMRVSMNVLVGGAFGFNRRFNATTAQEAATAGAGAEAHRGVAKGVILVTHLANWRQGIGVSPTVANCYGGSRPAWENIRMVHAAMEAAKWCAMQANTSTTTYFTDGPMKWVWGDQITEKDLR